MSSITLAFWETIYQLQIRSEGIHFSITNYNKNRYMTWYVLADAPLYSLEDELVTPNVKNVFIQVAG
jgi:hypothetical protein